MKMNKIYTVIWSALFAVSVNGQVRQPHSLYFMETIPQISQVNPAFQPRANGYVMLPCFNFDFNSDLAVRDLLQKQDNKLKWDLPVEKQFDYDKLRKSIGKKATMINVGTDVDVIGFGFRAGSGYFSFGVSEHVFANTTLPSDIFNIIDKGFPDKTTLDFLSLNTSTAGYMQILIGYSGKVNDKLSIGMNIKPLFGHVAIAPKIQKIKLSTGEQLWDLDGKGNIYSSAPIEVIMDANDEDKIDKVEFRDFSDYTAGELINHYILGFNNPGIALDLGAAYKITERITVSASLNNLGFISWNTNNDLNSLNSIPFEGKYLFNGIKYDVTSDENFKDVLKSLGDSIVDAMNYSVKDDKFKTMLTPVLYAGASYNLTQSVSVGLLSRTAFWKNSVRQSFNASVYLQPYSFVAMNLGATYQIKGNVSFGGGFTIFGGPLQFYLLVDNVPVYYSTISINDGDKIPYIPERLKTITLRAGLNLVFGKHGYINRPMLDKGKSSWN